MSTFTSLAVDVRRGSTFIAWAPAAVVPITVQILTWRSPSWVMMWSVALAIYFSLKWLTLADARTHSPSLARSLSYLLLWPGMNANAFLGHEPAGAPPTARAWLAAFVKIAFGLMLMLVVTPWLIDDHRLLAGWCGMTGIIFVLHFGVFHLLSLVWRSRAIAAEPIMDSPLLARSLSDFWGRRWNLAFRDLSFHYVLRPLAGRVPLTTATLLVFTLSGFVHEWVITVPAQSGWGGPTLYFLLQGLGLVAEKSDWGRRLGLGRGVIGQVSCAAVTIGPVGLLFPAAFVLRVIIPTLTACGVLNGT
ncbi:MAG: membrane bound O-acyl transferase family-domain-containing protein [Planctomycetaceae bacterium]|nr:membrane bound O-acyl transferase family-domain-containing protein [Planctomycetaceae bacterium]